MKNEVALNKMLYNELTYEKTNSLLHDNKV